MSDRHANVAVSVIVCTHDPRREYLSRTLEALRSQTLPSEAWELLIVDNASHPPVASDIGWHPHGRLVREEAVGLTNARACGIRRASAGLLVFVDDDNLLAPDYLARALEIEREWPILGTWGGQIAPEFEHPPEEWTREYWNWIAIREFDRDRWSNLREDSGDKPYGAGICVRRRVAEAYVERLAIDPNRRVLDRKGKQLLGGGDTDLCLAACDIGFGSGIFSRLKLTHLIPAERLEEGYLLELVEAMTCSHLLLNHFMGKPVFRPSRSQRLLRWYESLRLPSRVRRFEAAKQRGLDAALQEIQQMQNRHQPASDSC